MKKLFLCFTAALFAMSVCAQEIPAKEKLEGEKSEGLENLKLAADLVKYGYKQQDALPLIQALQIISDTESQPLVAEKDSSKVDFSNNKEKHGFVTLDRQKLISDAKAFSNGDKTLDEMIAKLEKETVGNTRGAVGGPCRDYAAVNAYSVYTWTCSFIKGRLAEVAVSGDGDTDLDLYVYDSNGNLIASDTDYSDDCYVRWVPRWTGRYYIKIVNRGGVYNRYIILTN